MPLHEALRAKLTDLVTSEKVVLFMKGTRGAPACGFSAQVVQILDGVLPGYVTVDVLADAALREGIKEFSQWPTIPQLYVDGAFVGGCDIVKEMARSGELEKVLGASDAPAPTITLTPAAAEAFAEAAADAGDDVLRFQINGAFVHELAFGPREPGDVEAIASGVRFVLDRASARRAHGVNIDYVGGDGGGFKIENPNEPVRVKQLGPAELKAMLEAATIRLFDVRPESERSIAKIEGATSLDAAGQAELAALDPSTPIAFLCHHGVRSQATAERVLREGFTKVYNLKGGIDAWSRTVDPSVPRY